MRRTIAILVFATGAILAYMLLTACEPVTVAARSLEPHEPQAPHYAATGPVVPLVARAETPRVDLDLPDKCDRLRYRDGDADGRPIEILTKDRPDWLPRHATRTEHQAELRRLIFAVADEMGTDDLAAEMIWRKAIYESSGNAGNVHIHTKDQRANLAAASKGRRRSSERWRHATIPVIKRIAGADRVVDHRDAWALGRGLYGMVTGLHMHRWSTDAPPWSLCDPVVATVVMIWSMRAGLDECHGSTLRDAYRRFSSGKCAIREADKERRFDRLAAGRVRGLKLAPFDPDARAVLGERWPESTTDRGELLARLRIAVADDRVHWAR